MDSWKIASKFADYKADYQEVIIFLVKCPLYFTSHLATYVCLIMCWSDFNLISGLCLAWLTAGSEARYQVITAIRQTELWKQTLAG